MRTLGATKHLKPFEKKKNVFESSIGQKAIINDVNKLLPQFTKYCKRKNLFDKFIDEQDFMIKVIEIMVLICGNMGEYEFSVTTKSRKSNKRKSLVLAVNKKILIEFDEKQCFLFLEGLVNFSEIIYKKNIYNKSKKDTQVYYKNNLSEQVLLSIMENSLCMFEPMPMVKPPIDWRQTQRREYGGYESEQYDIVRDPKKTKSNKQLKNNIICILNDIQSVPWKVNVEVLEQLKKDINKPNKLDYIKSKFPNHLVEGCRFDLNLSDMDQNDPLVQKAIDVRTEYFAQRAQYANEVDAYKSDVGKWISIRDAIFVAEHYIGDTIYFPHNYDYRGRIYPIPTKLSPQGSDAAKGVLLFAETEPLTEKGILWNWSYLASLYGYDKNSFDERVELGKTLLDADYNEAEEPYQFLSHQLEIKKWIIDPTYTPNTRIHLDACNSGSQFTSMLTGDIKGCLATNVIPNIVDGVQKREDAYLLVANKSIEYINDILNNENSEHETFLKSAHTFMIKKGRKICKKPVMVSNYGGTDGGRVDIIKDYFKRLEFDPLLQSGENARILSNIIGDATKGVLKGGKQFENYIQAMSKIFAMNNLQLFWETGDGFKVNGSKKKVVVVNRFRIRITGTNRESIYTEFRKTNKIDKIKTKLSISPNYVHSLDAEFLRRVAERVFKITPYSSWIHDSFGVHPNHADDLLKITKEEFFKMAIKDPLKKLHESLCNQLPDDKKTQKELSKITVPLRSEDFTNQLKGVFKSEYFFS